MARVFETPRPVPSRLAAVVAGGSVIVLALPVFLVADLPLAGWALGAALWVAAQLLGLVLTRLRLGADNLAHSGVVGIGMSFRAVAVMAVAIAVATVDAGSGSQPRSSTPSRSRWSCSSRSPSTSGAPLGEQASRL